MDQDQSSPRRTNDTPQAIPLQDLSRPPEHDEDAVAPLRTHRRTLSERSRDMLRAGGPIRRHPMLGQRYAPLEEGSTSRSLGNPYGAQERDDNQEVVSPVDGHGFQQALGFAGLRFNEETPHEHRPFESRIAQPVSPDGDGLRNILGHNDSVSSLTLHGYDDFTDESPAVETETTENDTTPLTDAHTWQRGKSHNIPKLPGQRHDRFKSQSVRFVSSPRSPRLGDDLPTLESNLGTPERRGGTGSLHVPMSPASAESRLYRAGTVVRKMSQRIVNLSNEPEVVEHSIRRRSLVKSFEHDRTTGTTTATSYSHDGTKSPIEKPKFRENLFTLPQPPRDWTKYNNPLKGHSIGLFPPENKLRTKLCDLLVHPATEPIILVLILLQTILLAVEAAPSVFEDPRSRNWGSTWMDYALLGLFVVYTAEVAIRVIVSGFIVNPIEYSTIDRHIGFKRAVSAQLQSLFALHHQHNTLSALDSERPSILRAFTGKSLQPGDDKGPRQQGRERLAHRAFLRHSFNRLDFLAVVSYWISLIFVLTGFEGNKHVYLFRMLSCLRILRLLSLTSGTSIILRSLKKAAPLLLNVALLIGFFWLLFAIIGLQSFKSSLRRTCVWVDPRPASPDYTPQPNYTANAIGNFQFCGGSFAANGTALPYLMSDGTSSGVSKGYLCPLNSYCVSGENPYNGTVSFDNLPGSLELIFVIMSSNTFTDLLYYLSDSDYLAAALFFAVGLVVMALWLMNLLIAVITSSFQVIREESKSSAFAAEETGVGFPIHDEFFKARESLLTHWYRRTFWLWIALITYGLICQAFRSATMGEDRTQFIDVSETIITLALMVEIIIRFVSDWRNFFKNNRNLVDLALAVITGVIQIPFIRNSGQPYAWLTIFQILRIYRVVLAVPWTRDLIFQVLGNFYGLLNLMVFVFLLTFLSAIFASQLFRGELPQQDDSGNTIHVTFATIYNSFLGMYQVLSSENWTAVMYYVTNYDVHYNTAWIGAMFFILWFIVSFFIVLNMFIAVIQENFDVSEDEKRLQQVKAFLQQKEYDGSSPGTLSLSSIFKVRHIANRRQDPLDYGPAMMEMLLKEAVVKDFLDDGVDLMPPKPAENSFQNDTRRTSLIAAQSKLESGWNRIVSFFFSQEPNPFYSRVHFSRAYEDLDPRTMAKEVVTAAEHRKRAQREYLMKYPKYNVSLFIFKPSNPIRRLCQKIVGPGRGWERIEGASPSAIVWYTFSAVIYAAIVAMVILACVTTPLYQKEYFQQNDFSIENWFIYVDLAFAVIFSVEATIKIIADGFFWTPNAYFRSSWGFIDGVVLITLWINTAAAFFNQGAVSRVVGAFKALRALRLLHVSDGAKGIFHSVIIRGGWKVVSAAFVSISLLIPFAIYGLNLFNGKFNSCNDRSSNIVDLKNCVDEYSSSPFAWDVLAPRQASNPYYDFDTFGSALFILFQIVSLEGWVDVMWSAESITGFFTQPEPFASQGNAIFFIIYNLMGTVFVLTLVVSVFMRNYTERTGVAYLTTDQRSWLELRKLLRQISPSKRPSSSKKRETWEDWCYRRAVRKTGRWSRFVTIVLLLHLILLCLEWYPAPFWWDRARTYIFMFLTVFYIANIVIRIIGLTWTRFRKSSWDLYSLFAVGGSFVTSILLLTNFQQRVYDQLHKLFLVSIALLLIPRNNQLDQLFKTAAASLAAIGNLVATWFVLYLVFAIAMTQTFGLTRFGTNETGNLNFRSVPKALILLFRMSAGEGWNAIMEDFANVVSPYCVVGSNFLDGDCGSAVWARALFIAWNLLSMYIFVNMFVSLIFESFSYVYQRSSGLSVISREETRRFKQAWAEYDPDGTGYISREAFPKFLRELSGVFDMRIYDGDFTIRNLKEDCKVSRPTSNLPIEDRYAPYDIDLAKLNKRLSQMPVEQIRQRRMRLNIFYEEVLVSADPDKGIAFTTLLMILAHYKVINDNRSLRLEEFLRRRARLQRVEEAVRRSIVISFFDTLYRRRQFRRFQEKKRSGRMTAVPQLQVPEIFIEDEDERTAISNKIDTFEDPSTTNPFTDPPAFGLQVTGPDKYWRSRPSRSDAGDHEPGSPRRSGSRSDSVQLSPSTLNGTFPSLSRTGSSQRRPSGSDGSREFQTGRISGGSTSLGSGEEEMSAEGRHYRSNSTISATDMMNVLNQSAWGESLRRSYTQRRSNDR